MAANHTVSPDPRALAEVFLTTRRYPVPGATVGGRRLAYWHGQWWVGREQHWQPHRDADLTRDLVDWLGNGATIADDLTRRTETALRSLCAYDFVGEPPTPMDLCEYDQRIAAANSTKTVAPQPIGAPQ